MCMVIKFGVGWIIYKDTISCNDRSTDGRTNIQSIKGALFEGKSKLSKDYVAKSEACART